MYHVHVVNSKEKNIYTCMLLFYFTKIENLTQKICELKGSMNRPTLKRVKMSADGLLGALMSTKVKESVDFKANLKTVKKEEEKVRLQY